MTTAVVILAGGEGRRIGGNKPMRRLAGQSLVERAEALGRKWSDIMALALRDPAQASDSHLPRIVDEAGIDGPLGGLAAALRFAADSGCETVLTFAVDMPFLPGNFAERLADRLEEGMAAIASSGGQLHPTCALWRVAAIAALPNYCATGRRSLRGFAEAIGYRSVDWSDEPADPFFNINSLADLAQAEDRIRS